VPPIRFEYVFCLGIALFLTPNAEAREEGLLNPFAVGKDKAATRNKQPNTKETLGVVHLAVISGWR
jgi:hypothetical protein